MVNFLRRESEINLCSIFKDIERKKTKVNGWEESVPSASASP